MSSKIEKIPDENLQDGKAALDSKPDQPIGGDGEGPIPQEILDALPEPAQKMIKETFLGIGPMRMPNPIAQNVKPEHITKLIENDANETDRNYRFRENGRRYTVLYVVIAIAAFFGLAFMFAKDDPALFKQIVSHIAALFGGFAAGWGLNASRNKDGD